MAGQLPEILLLLLYTGCLLFIFCYSLAQLHLTILFRRAKNQTPKSIPLLPENWPNVTVQLPVYNERFVIERLLNAVAAFRYPRLKLQIQVLDDSTDETVGIIAKKVAELQQQGLNMVHVQRKNREGYKAGALQHGLEKATGEFIAIFDADFVPEPDFLERVLPAFSAPEIGVVQTRWGHLNVQNSILTRLQAFGLDAHFTIEQTGRNFGKHFINFNGTAGIWRKKCIQDAGGWEADTLTEDLDLSYRAQLKNWEFLYLQHVVVPAELPPNLPALRSQQFRWTKGAAETLRKNAGKLWHSKLPFFTKLHAWFHLLNSTVFLSIFLAALASLPLLFIGNSIIKNIVFRVTSVFISGFFLLFFFYFNAYKTTHKNASFLKFCGLFFLFITFSMGLCFHNSVAVLEGFSGRKTPFIRTPKYNLTNQKESFPKQAYKLSGVSGFTLAEALLALVFWWAFAAAFWLHDFRLAFFHAMLATGFSLVTFFAIKDSFVK